MEHLLLYVQYGDSKHTIQLLKCSFDAELVVHVDDDLTVHLRGRLETVLLLQLFMVVYLAIIHEMDMRYGIQTKWLLTVQVVHNGQPVKCKVRVCEMWNRFNPHEFRSTVADGD